MEQNLFRVVDDYLVEFDGDYFDMHKPSNIRSLVTVMNYHIKKENSEKLP